MKNSRIFLLAVFFFACTNKENKDSVEIADSTNRANIDSAVNNNRITIDKASASFLVDAADLGMAEIDLGALATQRASSQRVKDFASMIVSDHSATGDQIKLLAAEKNVRLPDSISSAKKKDIDDFKQMNKKGFDKAFMDRMVRDHEEAIKLFENALTGTKDTDVNSFADRT